MSATSPAAKISPMASEAIKASETSRSALMSCSNQSAFAAPATIGTPQSATAIQARSKCPGRSPASEQTSTAADTITPASVRWDSSRSQLTIFMISSEKAIAISPQGGYCYHSTPCSEMQPGAIFARGIPWLSPWRSWYPAHPWQAPQIHRCCARF